MVTGCVLRELLEHYAQFLDKMHVYALAVLQKRQQLDRIGDPQRVHRKFHRCEIPEKLKTLHERFNVAPRDTESIAALYEARNCLTHDFGNVTAKRCNGGDRLVLPWRALDFLEEQIRGILSQDVCRLFREQSVGNYGFTGGIGVFIVRPFRTTGLRAYQSPRAQPRSLIDQFAPMASTIFPFG